MPLSNSKKYAAVSSYVAASISIVAAVFISSFSQAHAAGCISSSIAPSSSASQSAVSTVYQQWKSDYVTSNGANGQLRVQRSSGDNYDTVSEGIGYGLLFAAYNKDQSTFNKLWAYEQSHLDPDGLMNWDINAQNYTIGYNGATDADEDMALALVMADKTWGGYTSAADQQISNIEKYEIEPGTYVVKPGDVWGGSSLLDTSYLAPAYYEVFQSYTSNSFWNNVTNTSYQILNDDHSDTAASSSGLFPDWSTSTGSPANGMSYQYGYDASRTPVRLAIASQWSCDSQANNLLTPFNNFFAGVGANNIADKYNLNGTSAGDGGSNIPLLAAAASAATSSTNTTYRSQLWNSLVNAQSVSYFPDSMRLFGLMVAGGMMTNPLQTTAATPPVAATTASSASIDIWWPTPGSMVSGTQPFKALVENEDINSYSMYWQVDGGQLNLMSTNNTDYPHKEADVNLSGWNWRGSGPYNVTFIAKDLSGNVIATTSTEITITSN